jgi:hypothetical protein
MRKLLIATLAAGLLAAAGTARAGDDPRALVEKAVKALGGMDRIAKVQAAYRKSKATYHVDKVTFDSESHSQGERIKITQKQEGPNGEGEMRTLVLEGDKGWINFNGTIIDLDDEMRERFRRARHADRVAGLTALLKDKEGKFKLAPGGEHKVKDRLVAAVVVSAEGQPPMTLYFDKGTGLLVKTSQRVPEDKVDNDGPLHEWYFSDYRTLDLAAPDEALLKAAKLGTDGPALLEYLKKRTPTPALRDQIRELVRQLSDPAFRVRSKASAELKKLGVEANALLRLAAQDDDREVARRAQECVEHLSRQPEATLVPAALRLIELRKPAGAVPVLLAYLPWAQDEKTADEIWAALAAVAMRDGKADPMLEKALIDTDALVRNAAQAALGKDGGAFRKRPGRRVVVEGLTLAGRSQMFKNGEPHMDLETREVRLFNSFPDTIFARPNQGDGVER